MKGLIGLVSLIVISQSQFVKRDPNIEGYMFNLTQSKFNYTNDDYKIDIGKLEKLFDKQQSELGVAHKDFIKTSEKETDAAKQKLSSLELKELASIDKDLNDQYVNISRIFEKSVPVVIQQLDISFGDMYRWNDTGDYKNHRALAALTFSKMMLSSYYNEQLMDGHSIRRSQILGTDAKSLSLDLKRNKDNITLWQRQVVLNSNIVQNTGGEQQLSWTVVTIFWSFWTIFMMLMMILGVTDKYPWTDCFASKDKSVDGDTTKDSHDHAGHNHAGHNHDEKKPCGGHDHAGHNHAH